MNNKNDIKKGSLVKVTLHRMRTVEERFGIITDLGPIKGLPKGAIKVYWADESSSGQEWVFRWDVRVMAEP